MVYKFKALFKENVEIKFMFPPVFSYSFKVFREGANFLPLSRLFDSFGHWSLFRSGILRSVSDEHRNSYLSSKHFVNIFLK